MVLNFLGTGTSVGVPLVGCSCVVCSSGNAKNKRYRSSAFIDFEDKITTRGILVDTTPDLRSQMLKLGYRVLEGVFYTHSDSDHINGIDDLRPFNFKQKCDIPIYADTSTLEQLTTKFAYAFTGESTAETGFPPRLTANKITPGREFEILGNKITPISIFHGKRKILGLRVKNLAYLTDCSAIPDESLKLLEGLDILVISALRNTPHPNHLTIDQAIKEIEKVNPKKAYLTHIAHELDHFETNNRLAKISSCQIELAYDGLALQF